MSIQLVQSTKNNVEKQGQPKIDETNRGNWAKYYQYSLGLSCLKTKPKQNKLCIAKIESEVTLV